MRQTNFGFKKIPFNQKKNLVQEVFTQVADKYDIMNDLMSLGVHRIWKNQFVNKIVHTEPTRVLDMGGGTGDIIFRLKKILQAKTPPSNIESYIVDLNRSMLLKGMERALDLGYLNQILWVQANAEKLPFKDSFFSNYISAFCFRNITDIPLALKEAYRALMPGGYFFCLEFSKVNNAYMSELYKLWSFKVIPKIGRLVANNSNAYQYLVESIAQFYDAESFKNIIEQAGFQNVKYYPLSFGIACIHVGRKPL